MDNFHLIYLELKQFIDFINLKKNWNMEYTFIPDLQRTNLLRCMGRIWDSKHWDINKQCKNNIFIDELCFTCYKKNTGSIIGRVNEYPDEKNVIKWYIIGVEKEKLNNRNIYKEIDLNKYKKYLEKKSNKINMSTIQESQMYKNEPKKIKFKIKSNLENEYQDFSLNKLLYSTKNKNVLKEWWDSNTINKIKIFDNINNSSGIFAIETIDDKDYLLNKNKVVIGEVREWKNDKIDSYFKNSNNVILDPYTNVPILEYEIYSKTSIYHNLASGIYREYRYNEEEDDFINTNSIELL